MASEPIKILILDDDDERVAILHQNVQQHALVTRVLEREHFQTMITRTDYDLVMLDHDLGGEYDNQRWNGSEAARFLAENKSVIGSRVIVIHSMNPVGSANMARIIGQADGFEVFVVPWGWETIKIVDGQIFFSTSYPL